MPKFKVGDKVRLTKKENYFLGGFDDNDICTIERTGCGGKKEYCIKKQQDDLTGYAMEDELELVNRIYEIGTIVKPQSYCIGASDIFKVVGHIGNTHNLEQLTFNGKTLNPAQLARWDYVDLELACPLMDIVTDKIIADIKMPKYLEVPKYDAYPVYIDHLTSQIMGLEDYEEYNVKVLGKEGEDKMKILEIYSREAFSKIDEKYAKFKKEIIEEDNVQKVIEDTENQINVMLDREEDNRITIGFRNYFEPKTQVKLVELDKQRDAEKINVEKLIEEVKARLEICDDNETSKVAVLKEYAILTSDGKIAEYKTEKKGKK